MKSFYQFLTMLTAGALVLFVLFEGTRRDKSTDNNAEMEFLVPPPIKTEAPTVKDDEEEVVFRCRKEVITEVAPEPLPQLLPSKMNE